MAPKSEAALARKAAAAARKAEKAEKAGKLSTTTTQASDKASDGVDEYCPRTCTGVLSSRKGARDIKIDHFSMTLGGAQLIEDGSIELTIGRRYGLIGSNGSGKSNFLSALALREVPMPEEYEVFHLSQEAPPSEMDALACVVNHVKEKLHALEKSLEDIMAEHGPDDDRLDAIYESMELLDPDKFEETAAKILYGLGFDKTMMAKATKDMSGGWRMRVSLAQALFACPPVLLLDEPTNHLDLEACVWLEKYLAKYPRCLIVVSHSQEFLNGVCSHIIHLFDNKLTYYSGNYDIFKRTLEENRSIQMKAYIKEQEDIKHIKQFISSCGTFSNLVKQAKSRQKVLDKMIEKGLTPKPTEVKQFQFHFDECERLNPPVMPFTGVAFSYSGKKQDYLYEHVDLAIDSESRIALVGPNGAGKSTLVKLMTGELSPCEGTIQRHERLRMAKYHQHAGDILDLTKDPLTFFMDLYPNGIVNGVEFTRDRDGWRRFLGRSGVSGKVQETPIGILSDGMRSRLIFAMMSMKKPNLILLDEPTNHLDMEAIDALAQCIHKFTGGVILISHDFRLLDQVAKEVWVCDHKRVTPWKDNIHKYKQELVNNMIKKGIL
eukprot:GHVH01002131.1.p1 GENE.GHVH01002131.1~~GHVH01002131.1.p1  ORF type:complete len:605 (+),score=100.61 GHVH01002131.1:225-2039(+)